MTDDDYVTAPEGFTFLTCKNVIEGLDGKKRMCGENRFELMGSEDGRLRIKCIHCEHEEEFWIKGGGPVED